MASLLLPILAAAAQATMGLVFLGSAVAKLRDWRTFHGIFAAYRLTPEVLWAPGAAGVVAAELIAGAGLVAGAVWGGISGAALLTLFAGAMAVNLLRGRREISCGCTFGGAGEGLRWRDVLRNIALAALLLVAAPAPSPDLSGRLLALSAASLLFVLLLGLQGLSGLSDRFKAAHAPHGAH
jgi:hypothetical protein